MRRALLVFLLALTLSLAAAPGARAAFYFSHRDGVRVAFRAQGNQLVWAAVVARLYCVGPRGRRHLFRVKRNFAEPESPLPLDRRRVFRWDTRGTRQEESFTVEEFLNGHVGRRAVVGHFEYFRSQSYGHRRMRCQTGSYPFGRSDVKFRAPRRR